MSDKNPDRYRAFTPPRAVDVERDGQWWPGWQSAWVRWPDGSWRAAVKYSVAVGQQHSQQVPEDRVRPRGE